MSYELRIDREQFLKIRNRRHQAKRTGRLAFTKPLINRLNAFFKVLGEPNDLLPRREDCNIGSNKVFKATIDCAFSARRAPHALLNAAILIIDAIDAAVLGRSLKFAVNQIVIFASGGWKESIDHRTVG